METAKDNEAKEYQYKQSRKRKLESEYQYAAKRRAAGEPLTHEVIIREIKQVLPCFNGIPDINLEIALYAVDYLFIHGMNQNQVTIVHPDNPALDCSFFPKDFRGFQKMTREDFINYITFHTSDGTFNVEHLGKIWDVHHVNQSTWNKCSDLDADQHFCILCHPFDQEDGFNSGLEECIVDGCVNEKKAQDDSDQVDDLDDEKSPDDNGVHCPGHMLVQYSNGLCYYCSGNKATLRVTYSCFCPQHLTMAQTNGVCYYCKLPLNEHLQCILRHGDFGAYVATTV
jgi:hypothetical protein